MEETPLWITMLVSWAPMLLLVGVWIYYMRAYAGRTKSGMSQMDYLEQLLIETRRHNEKLETLLARLADK